LDSEPALLATQITDQKCGHANIVASDGHSLRATPRLRPDNSNFNERMPEGTQVQLIDCRFWTNRELQTWVAVRTPSGKLGWMLVQPDAVQITIYATVLKPPAPLTSIPPGTLVAYVPSSANEPGSASEAAVATSMGLDFVPVVGDVKGVAEAATGRDLITGEELGDWRWFGLLGLVGLAELATVRHADEAADAARLAGKADEASEAARAASKADEAVDAARSAARGADALREAGKLGEAADSVSDTARAAARGRSLADEAAEVVAKFEQPCSFTADTLVLTRSGLKPISTIRTGEYVLAYDEWLGASEYYPVSAVLAHVDPQTLILTIGHDEIETTAEHPFYVRGQWVPAGALSVGDPIASASGTFGQLVEMQVGTEPEVMYNLTVAQSHTYYVGTGQWLVHNACGRILRRNLASSVPAEWRNGDVEWQAHHIIPVQEEGHDFIRKAVDEGGWDFDGAGNGVALPVSDADAARLGYPAHRGPHPSYSASVRTELDALQSRALADEAAGAAWSGQKYATELQKLADRMKAALLGSAVRLR
jgi:hypothetical protein